MHMHFKAYFLEYATDFQALVIVRFWWWQFYSSSQLHLGCPPSAIQRAVEEGVKILTWRQVTE